MLLRHNPAARMPVDPIEQTGTTTHGAPPDLSVAVVSNRPIRLRWLLNALEAQTLPRAQWEVVVLDDSPDGDGTRLLRTHPLFRAGLAREVAANRDLGLAAKRNATWRATRGATIVFTDDDCRPPAEWLERMQAAAAREGRAVVQGATRPDPHERAIFDAAPRRRSQLIDPPVVWAQTCNIAYPRAVLERLGGFDESSPNVGEDSDLAARARASGVPYRAAPEALTYHAVEVYSLRKLLRWSMGWGDLAYLFRRHPELRAHLPLWSFWKVTHVWFSPALFGAIRSRRNPTYLALAIPWVVHAMPRHGANPRGRLRGLSELPGRAAMDAAEIAGCVRGSVKHRTLLL